MNVFVCIDDTDSLESRGTGELAELLAGDVEKLSWGTRRSISRHQLLVHPDIPFTSHNSSMCFMADMGEQHIGSLIEHASEFLVRESAAGSDPGLCIAVAERLTEPQMLVEFGYRAKSAVLKMSDAYSLAEQLGVHLSSHGGTGQGVIGALAGVGLRLGGNDGRLRGSLQIPSVNEIATVADILAHPEVDEVRTAEGFVPDSKDRVRLVDKVKTVLLGGKFVLLIVSGEGEARDSAWRTCTRQQLKRY